jgi:predicted GNAT family N-acyltransferase
MTSHLNHLVAQQRNTELVSYAEQARLANEARRAASASSPRWNIGRLLSTRRLKAARVTAAAQHAMPGPSPECLRCDP